MIISFYSPEAKEAFLKLRPEMAPSFFPSDLSCRLPSSLSLSSKAAAAAVEVMIIRPPPSPPVLVSKLSSVRVRHVGSKSRKKPPTNDDVLCLEAAASLLMILMPLKS